MESLIIVIWVAVMFKPLDGFVLPVFTEVDDQLRHTGIEQLHPAELTDVRRNHHGIISSSQNCRISEYSVFILAGMLCGFMLRFYMSIIFAYYSTKETILLNQFNRLGQISLKHRR